MIEVRNIIKSFDGFRALDGLSMSVPGGSIYGLVGPNGAGKSTLIRNLTGIYRPDSGEIRFDGKPVFENLAVKSRIASIPDELYFFLQASVLDMMRFYRGIYPAFDPQRYRALKEVFGIRETQSIRRLSRGMQKQVAFWLALCCRPDYLILDEPVDGLDPVMRRQVWSLILSDAADRGMTVLVSSHNLRELEDVCDHVGILNHGKLLLERSLADLQGNVVKMQVVFQGDAPEFPPDLEILHQSRTGRIYTLIIRDTPAGATNRLAVYAPILMDAVPLTLEEIFIYELGGADYAVKDILL
ncbi:ABC transporter ATP-binding protein [Papillibacter cinnamivorans]|uniref:ABC-2 type transport system ATP-binding protein n=1 Tax=Papillibacter cinnamivorans DSM 12816 TaxID=1122930 RepID=A0A1W1ZYZ1_9FIRM|nr:ABC transporter ATP-binding protein [Papillibacter cinnamivorans]SMC53576.1 ABC-2 type transport system ATP-binding protein [Papillibacter cinnamivorans DSM 12816]